jgi:uncharacterized LabA/DUF88 family protein
MRRRSKQKPVYAFIDSQNLNVTVQKHGWKLDWKKLRTYLAEKHGVTKAFMFIGYVPEFEDMYQQLHESGYLIVLKPTFDMTRPRPEAPEHQEGKPDKEEDKKPTKGNVDADLVLWAMKELPNYSKAIIASGDGDFYSLVEYLQEQGKLHKVMTPSGNYSGLYNKYDEYIERLDQSKRELAYRTFKRKPHQQG